jgi:hypothetical protein
MYRRLYIAFIDHVVIRSQGPLNVCCSLNYQFSINNWISREEEKQRLKRIFMYFGENCGKYIHYIPIHMFVLLTRR